jgi:hypothetical protein
MAQEVVSLNGLIEAGLTELIGPDDAAITAGEYTNTADFALSADLDESGEILSVLLVSTESGIGAVQTPAGTLLFFDADPNTSAGDTSLTAAEWQSLIGFVTINTTDWVSDGSGAAAFKATSIPFHICSTLFVVFTTATGSDAINAGAPDNEELDLNFWYRRDS